MRLFFRVGQLLTAGLIVSCLMLSCSSSNTGNSASGGSSASPESRWPETGRFSYRYSVNDCQTGEQVFTKKADYCLGLTDQDLNHGCALDVRRSTYKNQCGNDFEERNIAPAGFWGYDSRLKKSCQAAQASNRFERASQYCAFLKDESSHHDCHWDDRKSEFERYHCAGDFSPEPIATAPIQRPTPAPTATAEPTPAPTHTAPPVQEPAIVRELREQGIAVRVYNPGHPLPGEAPFNVRLGKFWKTLEALKVEILARRASIKEITVAVWTSFDSPKKELTLDVDLSAEDYLTYFPILDHRLAWEGRTGILLDLGIEIFGHEPVKTQDILEKVSFLGQNEAALTAIRGAVKIIEIDSYTRYWLDDRKLNIQKERFYTDLLSLLPYLKPAAEFLPLADSLGIEVTGGIDMQKDPKGFSDLFSILNQEKQAITELKFHEAFKSIEASTLQEKTYFSRSDSLSVASSGPGLKILPEVLRKLAFQFKAEGTLGIPIESDFTLNEKYIEAASRLEKRLDVILKKKNAIQSIALGIRSSFMYGSLTIGSDDTLADLDAVLNKI